MTALQTDKTTPNLTLAPVANLPDSNPPVGGKLFPAKVQDDSINSCYLDRAKFEQIFSIANMFAKSQMVPEHFRGKPEDCFIICQLAFRMGTDPFMLMQNSYIVHGRPGFEAKLAIAQVNSSGLFEDPLHFTFNNAKPCTPDWTVTVAARRRRTGTECSIDFKWETAVAEGWVAKSGSKWKTMSSQMMMYRGSMFFARVYCPEVLLGIQTVDEIEDFGPTQQVDNEALTPGRRSFGFRPDRAIGAANADQSDQSKASAAPDGAPEGRGATAETAAPPPPPHQDFGIAALVQHVKLVGGYESEQDALAGLEKWWRQTQQDAEPWDVLKAATLDEAKVMEIKKIIGLTNWAPYGGKPKGRK